MRVLIVGGAGYVGGAVTDLLAETGHEMKVFDALLYEEDYRKRVPFVPGDIRDRKKLLACLDWADAVVWLAAIVGDGACALNPDIATEINQSSVEWLAKNYDGRIVFISTCSVYGVQDKELDEGSPTNPLSVYAATKLAAEKALAGKNAIIFRLGTLFGVGDLFSRIRLDLVVNTLVVRAAMDGVIRVFGGNQFRPLLHVRDAARAVIANLETSHAGVFNLNKQNVRIIDLAYQVRNHFPDIEIERTEIKFQDARNYRVQSEKAARVFGFQPGESIDGGIEEVKGLVVNGRIKDVNNPRYTNHLFLERFRTHVAAGTRSDD
jgi:nucleoside-diphosphate-sugar epimerase